MSGFASSNASTIAQVAGSAVSTSGFCIDSVISVVPSALPPLDPHAARAATGAGAARTPTAILRRGWRWGDRNTFISFDAGAADGRMVSVRVSDAGGPANRADLLGTSKRLRETFV